MRSRISSPAGRALALGSMACAVLGVTAACGSSGSAGGGGSGSGSHVLKIGAVAELTGPFSASGTEFADGVKAAVYHLNHAGGITVGGTKYTFQAVTQDDKSDPTQAGLAAQTLVNDDHVQFIFGPNSTPLFNAVVPVAYKGKAILSSVAYIAGADLNQGVVAPYTDVFADLPGAAPISIGTVNASLKLWPGMKTAAILFPSDASYDPEVGLIESALKTDGLKVTDVERFDDTTTDFTPFLTKIKAARPDLLVSGVESSENIPIGGQAASLGGVTSHLLMFGGTSNNALSLNNGHAAPFASGWTAYGVPDEYSNAGTLPGFLADYKAANGQAPAAANFDDALLYYAPVLQLAKAIEKAGSVDDTAKISQAMTSVSVPGLLGAFRFNAKHQAQALLEACSLPANAIKPSQIICKAIPPSGA